MPIHMICDCGKAMELPGTFAGKSGTCKACGKKIVVPKPAEPFAFTADDVAQAVANQPPPELIASAHEIEEQRETLSTPVPVILPVEMSEPEPIHVTTVHPQEQPKRGGLVPYAFVVVLFLGVGVAIGFVMRGMGKDEKPVDPVANKVAEIVIPQGKPEPQPTSKPKSYRWSELHSLRTLEGPLGKPTALAFSKDGRYLATGSDTQPEMIETDAGERIRFKNKGEIKVWDVIEDRAETVFTIDGCSVSAMAFSPDSKTFIVDGGGEGAAYSVPTWARRYRFSGHQPFTIAISGDSKIFFSSTTELLRSVSSGREEKGLDNSASWYYSFSTDGKSLVTYNFDSAVILEYPSWKLLGRFPDTPSVGGVGQGYAHFISPNGNYVVSGRGNKLCCWDISNPRQIKLVTETKDLGSLTSFNIASDSRALAVGTWSLLNAGKMLPHNPGKRARPAPPEWVMDGIAIFSIPDLEIITKLGISSPIVACEFQPNGSLLAVLTERGEIILLQAPETP